MAVEELREHNGLRKTAWVVVWIISGLLAFMSLTTLGPLARDVAGRVLYSLGMFGPFAGIIETGIMLLLIIGAVVLPVVVIVRLVRALSAPRAAHGPGVFKEVFTLPVLLASAFLVVCWSALFHPFGRLDTGTLVNFPPGLFYLGLVLLCVGVTLFATDRHPSAALATTPGAGTDAAFPQEKKQRDRSHLGAFTLGALLIIVAIIGLVGSFGITDVDVRIIPALALTVLAAGMLVGTWVGKARWLTILCLLTLPFVAVANIIDVPISGGWKNVTYSPHTSADLQDSYSYGMGTVTLDLSKLDVGSAERSVDATVAAGDLTVIIPADIHVVIDASVRAGELSLSGMRHGYGDSGLDISASKDFAQGSPGLLRLTLHIGVGSIDLYTVGQPPPKPSKPHNHRHRSGQGGGGA